MIRETQAQWLDKYLYITEPPLNIISVFDDLRYDRSDADMLSPGMRKHVIKRLAMVGFRQKTGKVLVHAESGIQCYLSNQGVLGSSPFHVTDYTNNADNDFFILTPTQTVCKIINHYPLEEAVAKACDLICKQPINLFKIMDYFEENDTHHLFEQAIPHLKYKQRMAVESEALRNMRSL